MGQGLERGRDAFDRAAWGRAYEHLARAADDEPLEVDDLERLASAAYLAGHQDASCDVWVRAHQQCTSIGDVARAARCAFWLAFILVNNGDLAQAGGWIDRAQRLLDERKLKCVERGYLRYAAATRDAFSGDVVGGLAGFRQAVRIGQRFRDVELVTLARIGEGMCLLMTGQGDKGIALLDEAMVAVAAREISPIATGDAFCTVISGCNEIFDVQRAREWTAALTQWCDSQPELVLYRGQCLIHRAELMLLGGEWSEAMTEAQQACDRLGASPGQHTLGYAAYVRGNLHRLRGQLDEAEADYRTANAFGHPVHPGLALLRLAQGRTDAAVAAIGRALDEAEDPATRTRLLGSATEIALAAGDVASARTAADELMGLVDVLDKPLVRAMAAHAHGAALLAEGDAKGALMALRRAWVEWRDLDARYDGARARLLIAQACRALGDDDGAEMELDAAITVLTELGAAGYGGVDLGAERPGGLTAREADVLALVAKGHTNREVAAALFISEKTVASHLSHIFTKLGLSSRAAATAYAYEHGLAGG